MGEISGPLLHGRPSYANFLSPNEINEINDSCKWSFTVPNFYVKFSTLLPLLHTQGVHEHPVYMHAFSLEKKSHFVGFNAENPSFPPPRIILKCLTIDGGGGGEQEQDRGRNSRSEIFRGSARHVESSKALSIASSPSKGSQGLGNWLSMQDATSSERQREKLD